MTEGKGFDLCDLRKSGSQLLLNGLPGSCIDMSLPRVSPQHIVTSITCPIRNSSFKSCNHVTSRDMLIHGFRFGENWPNRNEAELARLWFDIDGTQISGQRVALRIWPWIKVTTNASEW